MSSSIRPYIFFHSSSCLQPSRFSRQYICSCLYLIRWKCLLSSTKAWLTQGWRFQLCFSCPRTSDSHCNPSSISLNSRYSIFSKASRISLGLSLFHLIFSVFSWNLTGFLMRLGMCLTSICILKGKARGLLGARLGGLIRNTLLKWSRLRLQMRILAVKDLREILVCVRQVQRSWLWSERTGESRDWRVIIILMLIVAARLISRGQAFATLRHSKRANSRRIASEEEQEEDVFKAYRHQVEKGSILRQFRKEVFRRSQIDKEWEAEQEKDLREHRAIQKRLKKGSKEESLRQATAIENRLVKNRTIFDEHDSHNMLSDYGDYTSYKQVYPTLQDRNLGEGEFLEHQRVTTNLFKFIEKLPDDYEEKQTVQKQIRQLPIAQQDISITDYGRRMEDKFNDAQDKAAYDMEEQRIHVRNKYIQSDIVPEEETQEGLGTENVFNPTEKVVDPEDHEEGLNATLSPRAVDTIYELYLQGWSVREISKRFGILPARTKFCVWVRAQLYHEVIPKMGVRYYMQALRYEQAYNEDVAYVDYGLDLDELRNDNILEEIHEWNNDMLDAQREEHRYHGAMLTLQKHKKFDRYEKVEVGTIGKEHKKYRLREWHIFRGKGSDERFLQNTVFRKLTKAQKKFNKVYY